MFTNACAINIPSPLKSTRVCLNNYSESMDKQCILTRSYSNVLPSIDIYWCSNQHAGNNYRTYWHTCWVEIAHTCWFITFCWWLVTSFLLWMHMHRIRFYQAEVLQCVSVWRAIQYHLRCIKRTCEVCRVLLLSKVFFSIDASTPCWCSLYYLRK